jgi:predicted secreted protein
MMEGLAFLPVPDLTIGIHLLRTLCPDDPPEAGTTKIQQLGFVPLYNNDDNFRLFCGMMEGLAFLPVPDLTIGIHLLRTLCPDDPPETGTTKIQQLGLVPLYNNDDDFRLFCGMMEDLAFLPVPDLTIGIHLLRTLCPDDRPEAAELLN